MELEDRDRRVVVDVLKKELASAEEANKAIKAGGWTGTGIIGYTIVRLKEIIVKLGG